MRCTISQIYFGKELHMFRTDLLSIIRSLDTVHTATGICHAEILKVDKFSNFKISAWQIPIAVYTVTPDDGQQICLKHVEFFIKINLRNIASRWFLL